MRLWSPDTCVKTGTACIIEEIYDGNEIIGGGQVLFKCEIHKDIPDDELYEILLNGENRVKNHVHRLLCGHEEIKDLGLHENKYNQDSSYAGVGLKKAIEYDWEFEGDPKDRKFKFRVKGADIKRHHKDLIHAHLETRFGKHKVEFIENVELADSPK